VSPTPEKLTVAPVADAPQPSRSMVNLAGVAFLPTEAVPAVAPSNAVRETLPSGTVRFWLLGEIEQGASTISPVKLMVPSAAKAPCDRTPATASDANLMSTDFCILRSLRR